MLMLMLIRVLMLARANEVLMIRRGLFPDRFRAVKGITDFAGKGLAGAAKCHTGKVTTIIWPLPGEWSDNADMMRSAVADD